MGDWRWGSYALTPSLPRVWDRSLLRVERLPRLGAGSRTEAAAEEILGGAGLAHRKVVCHRTKLGERLAPELRARGWAVHSLAVMSWPAARAVPSPAGAAAELDPERARAFHARLSRTAYSADEDTAAQLAASATARGRIWGAPPDDPAAMARLELWDGIGEIDDVGTLPDAHRRGLGTRVVLASLAAAVAEGARLVFLRADENDWPWEWYARLGFEVVGRHFEFVGPTATSG